MTDFPRPTTTPAGQRRSTGEEGPPRDPADFGREPTGRSAAESFETREHAPVPRPVGSEREDIRERVKEEARSPERERDTREKTGETVERVRERTREARDKAVAKMSEAGRRLRDRSLESMGERKRQASEQVGAVGAAVHDTAGRLREEGNEDVADWFEYVAEQVDQCASWIRERDFGHIRADLERMARNRPGLFLGSLFVGGLAVSRFLKASPPEKRRREEAEEEPWEGTRPEQAPVHAIPTETGAAGYSSSAPGSVGGGSER